MPQEPSMWEDSLNFLMAGCKHDGEFKCVTISNMQQGESFYAFACEYCLFYLNFDPTVYPRGVVMKQRYKEETTLHKVTGADRKYEVIRTKLVEI